MYQIIDCHCHLPHYGNALEKCIEHLISSRFVACLIGGINPDDWRFQLKLAGLESGLTVYRSFGLHPWYVANSHNEQLEQDFMFLESILVKADAIGEIGLDYAVAKSLDERNHQLFWFKRQLALVKKFKKPLVLHVVRAHHDMLAALKQENIKGLKVQGMVHSFTGNASIGQSYLDLGLKLSISPLGLKALKPELIESLPPDMFLIESDAPSRFVRGDSKLAVVEHVEEIMQVIEKLAKIRSQSFESIVDQNRSNVLAMLS